MNCNLYSIASSQLEEIWQLHVVVLYPSSFFLARRVPFHPFRANFIHAYHYNDRASRYIGVASSYYNTSGLSLSSGFLAESLSIIKSCCSYAFRSPYCRLYEPKLWIGREALTKHGDCRNTLYLWISQSICSWTLTSASSHCFKFAYTWINISWGKVANRLPKLAWKMFSWNHRLLKFF